MSDTGHVEGVGASLEDATKAAFEKIPPKSGADILVILTVESWGCKVGGFAGLPFEYWVKASYKFS